MNKTINQLTELTTAAENDELILFDVSENNSKKITKANFNKDKVGIITASNVDLNTLKAIGVYKCSSATGSAHHYPVNTAGTMSVFTNDSINVSQMYYADSSTDIYTRNFTGGSWGNWTKVVTEASLNDWKSVTITMESGYTNELGTPNVYYSPSRKLLLISKLDAKPTNTWVVYSPFCRFTRPAGFYFDAWGMQFIAFGTVGASYPFPIACSIWVNPNDNNELGLQLVSLELTPGGNQIGNNSIRIHGITLQGKQQ